MKRSLIFGLCAIASAVMFSACDDDSGSSSSSKTKCGDTVCTDDQTCQDGVCIDKQTNSCPPGQELCGSECVNLQKDYDNCGTCGNACLDGFACKEGSCVLSCTADQTACGDRCVDVNNDDEHCGKCDAACTDGKTCQNGGCVLNCLQGWEVCGDTCVNLQNDNSNCGSCGTKCGSEDEFDDEGHLVKEGSRAVCVSGTCKVECTTEQTLCGEKCATLASDAANCGICGHVCSDEEICKEGKCILYCSSSQLECSGTCINPLTDNNNCGDCGRICQNGDSCQQGECIPNCPEGQTECGEAGCVDTNSTFEHCGKCGNACETGQVCNNGGCKSSCEEGQINCDGNCIDPNTDTRYCGASDLCGEGQKGTACDEGFVCKAGGCECPDGQILCLIEDDQTACINPASSDAYCGCNADSAGMACDGLAHSSENACIEGKCDLQCEEGFDNCNSDAADGCESELANDVSNCGACGNACASEHASEVACVFGKCSPTCEKGYTTCEGSCIDTSSDGQNCGACGNACSEGFSCQNSYCVLTECTKQDGKYASITINGNEITAYCIKDTDEFEAVRDAVNKKSSYPDAQNTDNAYILLSDIDLGLKTWKGIGDTAAPFNGIFLGNGKSISGGLSCTGGYCGIFGYADGATLDGFSIEANLTVGGNNAYTGALVGYAKDSTISNTAASGTIKGYQNTGGIVGYGTNNQMTALRMTGSVTGTSNNTGGIIGNSNSDTITDATVSNISIVGSNYVGGIAGIAAKTIFEQPGFIQSKLNNSQSYSGGIAGYLDGATINHAKASGRIINSQQFNGLMAGQAVGSTFANSLVENGDVTGTTYTAGFVGHATNSKFTSCIAKADITASGDYAGGFVGYATGTTPFKSCSSEKSVTAAANTYVGGFAGFATNGVTFDSCTSASNAKGLQYVGGFIGQTTSAKFYKVNVSGTATGEYIIGGMAGYATDSTFNTCSAKGDVIDPTKRDDHIYAGGFIGYCNATSLELCVASGDVVGTGDARWEIGGFIGGIHDSCTLVKCAAFGNVTMGGQECGSLVGEMHGTVTIDTTFATGDVRNCTTQQGAILGLNWSTPAKLFVSDSYTTGIVKKAGNYGAFVGYNQDTVKFVDTYYWEKSADKLITEGGLAAGSTCQTFAYNNDKTAVIIQDKKETKLVDILNTNQNVWEQVTCALKGGPATGTPGKYAIPVIKGMKLDFCE
ncbi:MAG: hypothetical protein IKY83_10845 [Proteobacteria bacterium]|nr:hypothetical protein [Pseudomonadota bacterium]